MIPGFPEPENNPCKGEKTITLTADERDMVRFVADYLNWEDFHQMYYEYNMDDGKSSPEMDAAMELWDGAVAEITAEDVVTLTEDERNMVAFISHYLNWEDFHQMYYEYNEKENESSPEMEEGMELWENAVAEIISA